MKNGERKQEKDTVLRQQDSTPPLLPRDGMMSVRTDMTWHRVVSCRVVTITAIYPSRALPVPCSRTLARTRAMPPFSSFQKQSKHLVTYLPDHLFHSILLPLVIGFHFRVMSFRKWVWRLGSLVPLRWVSFHSFSSLIFFLFLLPSSHLPSALCHFAWSHSIRNKQER